MKKLTGDLLASRFVRGSYCAYPFVLTVVVTGIGQLIATLVLEARRAAARHLSEVRTIIRAIKKMCRICTKAKLFCCVSCLSIVFKCRRIHLQFREVEISFSEKPEQSYFNLCFY